MELNLLPILNFDGRKIDISEDISLTLSDGDNFQLTAPVHFDGTATNVGGTIEIKGRATANAVLVCDRCLESFDSSIEFEIDEAFKKEDEFSGDDENPDISTFVGTTIDLVEIVYANLFMNLPSKFLCRDDCEGLCPVCGKNLNQGDCDCSAENTDPRFDILDKLL